MRTRNPRWACIGAQQESSLQKEHLRFLIIMKRKLESLIKVKFTLPKIPAQELAGLNFAEAAQLGKLISFREKWCKCQTWMIGTRDLHTNLICMFTSFVFIGEGPQPSHDHNLDLFKEQHIIRQAKCVQWVFEAYQENCCLKHIEHLVLWPQTAEAPKASQPWLGRKWEEEKE